MSLNREFAEMVQEQNSSYRFILPLISGLEFLPVAKQQSRWMQEFTTIQEMVIKQGWKNLPELLEPLHNPDVAVVITNAREQIQWVNEGFFRMTGFTQRKYSAAIPAFCRGRKRTAKQSAAFARP